MNLSAELARIATAPVSELESDRLRALTLGNLAAGLGKPGAIGRLIDQLPFCKGRPTDAYRLAARFHARTQDDFYPLGRTHVGAVALAATLAFADLAGERMLSALAAGYRVICLASGTYSPEAQRRGMRPSGMFGPLGAAAAAAVSAGLDESGVAAAIALASTMAAGTNQSWISGTDEWLLEVGSAARAGVEAVQLVQAGARSSELALEGPAGWARAFFDDPDAARLRQELRNSDSRIAGVACKLYPVSGIAQVPTHLACQTHLRLEGARPGSVAVFVSSPEASYPGSANRGPFQSRSDALMSIAFCVACGIADGRVTLDRLENPNAPDLLDLVEAVKVVSDDGLEETLCRLAMASAGGHVELRGSGDEILYADWAAVSREPAQLASNSEAPEEPIRRAVEALRAERPDAARLRALVDAAP